MGTLEVEQRLRSRGLRVTRPRTTVLQVLDEAAQSQQHLSAGEVAALVRQSLGSVSTQAVYDVLDVVVGAGLARRFEPAGRPSLYEARAGDNHHHLVCRSCGRTVDVDCVVGHAACLTPSDAAGFVVDEAEVFFWGRCPDCRSHNSSDSQTAVRRKEAP